MNISPGFCTVGLLYTVYCFEEEKHTTSGADNGINLVVIVEAVLEIYQKRGICKKQ
jgi:hypothetical protein